MTVSLGRPPAHAGAFYPAEPEELGQLIDRLLADAVDRLPAGAGAGLLGALVPHAGVEYSGRIAALGWAAVGDANPTTLVLAGTDHFLRAGGVAVWTGGPWATPIGAAAVHVALAEQIVGLGSPFRTDDAAHTGEHSLEVQIPFILRACPRARIVPLLVGVGGASVETAGAKLGRLLASARSGGERVVIVASSDFAHYPPAAVTRRIDERMLEPLLRLDATGLARREVEVEATSARGVACGMCGVEPVQLTLTALRMMGARRATLLGHGTSADVAPHDELRTVGYASLVFTR